MITQPVSIGAKEIWKPFSSDLLLKEKTDPLDFYATPINGTIWK